MELLLEKEHVTVGTMNKIDKKVLKHKTSCCGAEWYRKGRANLRCKKCDEDVTMEIIFLYQALSE